jgi:hypothetical protein
VLDCRRAGAPIILSVLAATGLGFLRSDAILVPIIGAALLIALDDEPFTSRKAGGRIQVSRSPLT